VSGAAAEAAGGGATASPRGRRAQYAPAGAAPLDATLSSKPNGGPVKLRPNLTGGALSARQEASEGFETWRARLDHNETPKALSARPSPRGRPRPASEDPARAAPIVSEPAADWEKQKLLAMMNEVRDGPALR
jgi:hypothetical protein